MAVVLYPTRSCWVWWGPWDRTPRRTSCSTWSSRWTHPWYHIFYFEKLGTFNLLKFSATTGEKLWVNSKHNENLNNSKFKLSLTLSLALRPLLSQFMGSCLWNSDEEEVVLCFSHSITNPAKDEEKEEEKIEGCPFKTFHSNGTFLIKR